MKMLIIEKTAVFNAQLNAQRLAVQRWCILLQTKHTCKMKMLIMIVMMGPS